MTTSAQFASMSIEEAQIRIECLYGFKLAALSPDRIIGAQEAVMGRNCKWEQIADWEKMTDHELLEKTGFAEAENCADLMVISEASFFRNKGAFLIRKSDLRDFTSDHLASIGECMYSGDLIIVSLDDGATWIFSHEGHYTTLPACG